METIRQLSEAQTMSKTSRSAAIRPITPLFRVNSQINSLKRTTKTRIKASLSTQINLITDMIQMVVIALGPWIKIVPLDSVTLMESYWIKSVKPSRRMIRLKTSKFNRKWNYRIRRPRRLVSRSIDFSQMRSIRTFWSVRTYHSLRLKNKWRARRSRKSELILAREIRHLQPTDQQWILSHLRKRQVKWN